MILDIDSLREARVNYGPLCEEDYEIVDLSDFRENIAIFHSKIGVGLVTINGTVLYYVNVWTDNQCSWWYDQDIKRILGGGYIYYGTEDISHGDQLPRERLRVKMTFDKYGNKSSAEYFSDDLVNLIPKDMGDGLIQVGNSIYEDYSYAKLFDIPQNLVFESSYGSDGLAKAKETDKERYVLVTVKNGKVIDHFCLVNDMSSVETRTVKFWQHPYATIGQRIITIRLKENASLSWDEINNATDLSLSVSDSINQIADILFTLYFKFGFYSCSRVCRHNDNSEWIPDFSSNRSYINTYVLINHHFFIAGAVNGYKYYIHRTNDSLRESKKDYMREETFCVYDRQGYVLNSAPYSFLTYNGILVLDLTSPIDGRVEYFYFERWRLSPSGIDKIIERGVIAIEQSYSLESPVFREVSIDISKFTNIIGFDIVHNNDLCILKFFGEKEVAFYTDLCYNKIKHIEAHHIQHKEVLKDYVYELPDGTLISYGQGIEHTRLIKKSYQRYCFSAYWKDICIYNDGIINVYHQDNIKEELLHPHPYIDNVIIVPPLQPCYNDDERKRFIIHIAPFCSIDRNGNLFYESNPDSIAIGDTNI